MFGRVGLLQKKAHSTLEIEVEAPLLEVLEGMALRRAALVLPSHVLASVILALLLRV